MKNKITKSLKFGLALFALGFLLTNCEKENTHEETISVEEQEQTLIFKKYSKENFEKNTKLISRIKEFNDKLIKNKSAKYSGKNVYNKEYDFTVYTDSATYIQVGDYHSYTFPLIQDGDEKMTNVFFELNEENEYDAFLVNYDYSANELKYKDFKSLSMKTSMKPIELAFNSLFARTMSYYRCTYTYEWQRIGTRMRNADSNTFEDLYGYVFSASECETFYYDNGDTKTYNSSDGTATVTIGGTTYGGTTSGSKTSPTPSPYDSEELMKINVVKSELNLKPLLYDSWINSNAQTVFEIYDFLVANLFSDESISFAKQTIDILMLPTITSTNQIDYVTQILRLINHLKQFGNIEDEIYAGYIESLIPEFNSMTINEVREIYNQVKKTCNELTIKYAKAIITPVVTDLVIPVVTYAIFEATAGTAIKLLQKIPISMVLRGTRLNKMVTKIAQLGTEGVQGIHIRELHGTTVAKAQELFITLTKNAISTANNNGVIVANMGNGNYITFRTVSSPLSPNVIATIDLNFPQLFSEIVKLKFYP